jgi:hypothetical protein
LVATQGVFSFRGRGIGDLKSVSLNATPLAITNLVKVLFVLNGMSTTSTPELDPHVLQRLDDDAAWLRDAFGFGRPARGCPVSLRSLIPEGERKRLEPLSRRVPLPAELKVKDPEPALPQFVNQSPWDEREVLNRSRAVLAETFADPKGLFLSDDPSFPKRNAGP